MCGHKLKNFKFHKYEKIIIIIIIIIIIKIKYKSSVDHPISSYGPAVSSVDFRPSLVL
jgi:hypothetical protein